jgi:hypothetical protein
MCKVHFIGCVKQTGARWRLVGIRATIASPLVAFRHATRRGDSGDPCLLCSQTRGTPPLWNIQCAPRTGAHGAVSRQPVLRRTRSDPGQIRNAACRRARRFLYSACRPDVWLLTNGVVSDQVGLCCGGTVRPASPASQKKQAARLGCLDRVQSQDAYERLREQALGSNRWGWDYGLSILLSQGMAAWLQYPVEIPAHPQVSELCTTAPRHELVFVLAALVIGRSPAVAGAEVHDV